jgi:O-antigen ligase
VNPLGKTLPFPQRKRQAWATRQSAALTVFGALAVAAPLLFGSVDRLVQVGLVLVFALGLFLFPPVVPKGGRWITATLVAVTAILLFKEFAPQAIFASTEWREVLSGSFGVEFPFTHHPEPARAIDTLLAIAIAAVWFLWVRTLTTDYDRSVRIAWLLFSSAAITSAVWLLLGHSDSNLIYGYRETPGWTGFGPFPNRNHTATFLAMGALVGCGCTARAGMRRRWFPMGAALVMMGLVVVALLESRSRGGLVALAVGMGVFLALAILRARSRKSVMIGIAALLAAASLLMAFGGGVLARFATSGDGDISTNVRWEIWQDGLRMWRDAPVFGHGVSTFEGLFPLYQKVNLVSQYVIHPESSWLLWLIELGALLAGVAALALCVFLVAGLRHALKHQRGYYLRIGAFAAVAALLCHSLWDVPAHRWGTAGFALAALALACPGRPGELWRPGKRLALVPVAIAVFWMLPFTHGIPAASPTSLTRLLIENATTQRVTMDQLERELRNFPLSFQLHVATALRQFSIRGKQAEAWRHFRTALRLRPGSWALAATAANAASQVSPGMTLHFWSVSVERAGHRAGEVLNLAHRATLKNPIAEGFWDRFVESHPPLLLDYALILPDDEEGRYFFDTWMAERSGLPDLSAAEVRSFYNALRRYGRAEDLRKWIAEQPTREKEDFQLWAAMLHSTGEDRDAWSLLTRHVPEPGFQAAPPKTPTAILEARWKAHPTDFVNAVAYAQVLTERGKVEESEAVISESAGHPGAPPWVLRKAAFITAEDQDYPKAVDLLLRGLAG